MKTYESLVDALADLKTRGYVLDFMKEPTCLYCYALNLWIAPDQFNIDEFYRFEENSSPDDTSVLYAISSYTGIKGTLVDGYGMYADSVSFDMARKLEINYR
ncbi:MAG: phosphoribosylpyrophosphate synthetase [Marivirga sp.]|nr:phosphoribosylpyrophosphate synthetase [Marivirga sp.]